MLFSTTILVFLLLIPIALCVAEYFLAKLNSPWPGLVIPCLLAALIFVIGLFSLPFALAAFLIYFWRRGLLSGRKSNLSEEEKSKLDDL